MLPSSGESTRLSAGSKPGGAFAWLERYVEPAAKRFGDAPAVLALRESLPWAFGGAVVALALLAAFAMHGSITERLRESISGAFAIMSVLLLVLLAVRLAIRLRYPLPHMLAASLLGFGFALPREALRSFNGFSHILGTSGLFTAIVICLTAAGVIGLCRRRFGEFSGSLTGALIVWIGSFGLYLLHISIAGLLATALAPLGTLGDSFVALFVITGIEALLWVFGIHGPLMLAAIVLPVYTNMQFVNTDAYHHHLPLPHLVVVSTFLFVFPGGAGATLPLVLLMLRSRVPRLRKVAYATILPSILNTNEPLIFGMPLVYNATLAIPFIIAPLVLVCITYAALALHFVNAPIYYVITGVPAFVNVFLATLDWRAVVLELVNIVVAGAIWFPFVRIYERAEASRD